jgi:hypothetical protein
MVIEFGRELISELDLFGLGSLDFKALLTGLGGLFKGELGLVINVELVIIFFVLVGTDELLVIKINLWRKVVGLVWVMLLVHNEVKYKNKISKLL